MGAKLTFVKKQYVYKSKYYSDKNYFEKVLFLEFDYEDPPDNFLQLFFDHQNWNDNKVITGGGSQVIKDLLNSPIDLNLISEQSECRINQKSAKFLNELYDENINLLGKRNRPIYKTSNLEELNI